MGTMVKIATHKIHESDAGEGVCSDYGARTVGRVPWPPSCGLSR